MPLAPELLAAPLAARGQRLSAAIDRHLANCAGTIGGVPMRGVWRRDAGMHSAEWGHSIAATSITLSVDGSLVPAEFAGQQHPPAGERWHDTPTASAPGLPVEITAGRGIGRYLITAVTPADSGRVLLTLQVTE